MHWVNKCCVHLSYIVRWAMLSLYLPTSLSISSYYHFYSWYHKVDKTMLLLLQSSRTLFHNRLECLKRKNVPVELMWDKRLRQVSVGRLFEVDIVIVDVFGNVLFQDNQIHKQSFIKSVVQFEMFKIDTWLTLSLCLWQLNEISWRIVYIELYGMISVSKMFIVFVSKANIV